MARILNPLFRRLRDERGITLVVAVGFLGMLSFTGATLVVYSNQNARNAEFSADSTSAYDLAESGIDEMASILWRVENNALNKYLLGYRDDGTIVKTIHEYDAGTVEWWGTLDEATSTWTLTSVGRIKNPTGPASEVTRTLTAKVPVSVTVSQPLNNPAWNYVYSTAVTGGECDMTLDNTVEVRTRLYVSGNLCLRQQAKIRGGANVTLVVQGKVTMYSNQNRIGDPVGTGYGPLAEVHVKNGCKWWSNAQHTPCVQGAGSAGYDELWSTIITATPPMLSRPEVDWDNWYQNASPGPYYPCLLANLGPTPTFDNDQGSPLSPDPSKRNLSVPGTYNLTGPVSYSCKTLGGELTWNATATDSLVFGPAKTLTVRGTIFIDGHVKVEPAVGNDVFQYNGQGTIYASGSVLIKNAKLCGAIAAGACDFASWNPNSELLTFVSNGDNGQFDVPSGVSIELKSAHFQGALYGMNKVQLDTSSKVDGPIVASEVVLGQSIATDDFPVITSVPAGMPGNPAVYAQPGSPELYSG